MISEWKYLRLEREMEEPEAHWLRTVLGRRGLRPATVELSQQAAVYLYKFYGARFGVASATPSGGGEEPVNGRLSKVQLSAHLASLASRVRMGQETFEALRDFAQRSPPTGTEAFNILIDGEGLDFPTADELEKDLRVTNVGVGLPPGELAEGAVVDPDDNEARREPTDLTGDEVIVAIIDDGIGIANERFRLSPTETRVEYFWDMQVPPSGANSVGSTNGQVFCKRQIDKLLQRHDSCDEEVYRKLGLIDHSQQRRQPLKFRRSHGTHVLDAAAGFDYRDPKAKAVAAKRPIIAVQLPSEVIAERSDAFTADWLKLALDKILYLADVLASRIANKKGEKKAKPLPIVVNFSFGTIAGPHDGQAPIDKAVRNFVRCYRSQHGSPECEVVMPAGNGFQSRTIARLLVGDNGEIESLPWRVQPDDKTSSYVQVWLPESNSEQQRIAVSLVPPRDRSQRVEESRLGYALDWELDDTIQARVYHQIVKRPNGRFRERVVIAIRSTESDGGEPRAPSGLWEIRMRSTGLAPGERVDVRIQRDDSLMGQKRTGRQSYFDHPDYVRFEEPTGRLRSDCCYLLDDCEKERGPVSRCGTFNAYATAYEPLVVGGYRRADGIPASYTGSGPTTSGKPGPEISAVTEDSPSHRGVLAAGTYSGSTVVQNGTSVAAPAITRVLAECFGGGLNKEDLVQSIQSTDLAGIEGPHGPYPPLCPPRQGAGRYFTDKRPSYRRRIED